MLVNQEKHTAVYLELFLFYITITIAYRRSLQCQCLINFKQEVKNIITHAIKRLNVEHWK